MDLAALGAFVAVGDTGGFRSAAAQLGVTSAGVSKAVSRLERELSVALLARTTRSVRLTSAGAAFHARAKAILADLDQAGREVTDAKGMPQGRLVIGASVSFGRMRVLPAVADYSRRFPGVEIEVRLADRVVDLVSEGVDVAVRIGHLPDSSLVASRVSRTAFVLCASPEYLAAHGTPLHPDDLHRHSVVGYVAPGTSIRFDYRFVVDDVPRTMTLPSRLTLDDGEALVAAALRSAGLIMVNDYLVERQIADGSLVRVLWSFEAPAIPISALHVPAKPPSPAIREFVAMLRSRLTS